MILISRSAALTALCCLCTLVACGGPLEPSADESDAAIGGSQSDPSGTNDLPGTGAGGDAAAEPRDGADEADEAPSEVLAASLAAWPFALEAFAIDAAEFTGETLVIAARSAEGPLLVRLRKPDADAPERPGEDDRGGANDAARAVTPIEHDRLALTRDEVSHLALVRIGKRLAAAWTAAGHLEVVFVDEAVAELGKAAPSRIAAEEGGAFAGEPVFAADDDGALACLVDGNKPICLGLDARLATTGVHAIPKRTQEVPEALWRGDDGFLLVLSRCLGSTCGRQALTALGLDGDGGATGKVRSLPEIQTGRGLVLVPDDQGLMLVARRVGAGEHSAWRVTEAGASELDGRYSRVVGGFGLEGRSLFVERSHLRMRKGFPVTGFQLRPVTEVKRKAHRSRQQIAREAFPDAIEAQIPTDVDQTFRAGDEAILFAGPRRQGTFRATAIRLPGRAPGGS